MRSRTPQPEHRPTYSDTGFSHWASCICGWRSGLCATEAEIRAQYRQHEEDEA